jgi:hypothetical protein
VNIQMSTVGRRAVVAGAVAAAVAGGAVIARAGDAAPRAAAAEGGLAIAPVLVEKPAAVGPVATITVANRSKATLDVTVKARPWVQSSSGAVSVDRRRTLGGVEVGDGSFALVPGATKAVSVTLRGTPAGGSTYGGIEVIGVPAGASTRKGVLTGYRLVSSLRLNPATPVLSLKAGTAKVTGTGSARAVVLPVRNAGNTVRPISGGVALKGPLGTRSRALAAVRVLPGRTVDFLLSSARMLPAGSYTATVRLEQGASTTTITKRLRVRR